MTVLEKPRAEGRRWEEKLEEERRLERGEGRQTAHKGRGVKEKSTEGPLVVADKEPLIWKLFNGGEWHFLTLSATSSVNSILE